MDFKTFIDTNVGANQDSPISNQVISMIRNDNEFPKTADIKSIALYIYKKLNHEQTYAFQKLLMFWKYSENNHRQPDNPKELEEINYIIDLQNEA